MHQKLVSAAFVLALVLGARRGDGAQYHYVNWTDANTALGTATGTITLPDSSTVQVDFEATYGNGSAGTLFGAQLAQVIGFATAAVTATATPCSAVLAGSKVAPLNGALGCKAALAFQIKFFAFAPAEFTNRTKLFGHRFFFL